MDPRTFPTKGNLMLAKNSLALAKQGYDLMDKKRNILIRELMDLIDEARDDPGRDRQYFHLCLSVSAKGEYREWNQHDLPDCVYGSH